MEFQKVDLNILYVEDESIIRHSTAPILKKISKEVFVACDGEEALELFQQNYHLDEYDRIDLIITDLNMPKMDGFKMLENIRKINDGIPAIITTAHLDDGLFEKVSQLDILNDYLAKPIDMKKLFERIVINQEKIHKRKEFLNLKKLHEQYEYAVNKKLLVSKTDPDGIITYVNSKFCEVSGYTKEELMGSKHNIIKSPMHPARFYEKMWEKITSKNPFHGIVRNQKKDGSQYIVDSTIIPILDRDGEIQEYISLRSDITKYVEKRDKEISLVEDKTLMLFTHELKSPLNAITSFISHISRGLQRDLTPQKQEKLLGLSKIIDSNAKSLLGIINTMLDISKLKSNKLKFNKEKFDLSGMVKEKIEIYSVLHEREVISSIPDSLIVNLDQKSLNHIVENLFTNAIKYSNSKVMVSLEKHQSAIVISIEDDGDGIAIENRDKIFKMFSQESEGRSIKEKSGTGVGLHLVKLLCDNNNFTIGIESSEKLGGALFKVTIPY